MEDPGSKMGIKIEIEVEIPLCLPYLPYILSFLAYFSLLTYPFEQGFMFQAGGLKRRDRGSGIEDPRSKMGIEIGIEVETPLCLPYLPYILTVLTLVSLLARLKTALYSK